MKQDGIYYGINVVTDNMLLNNRKRDVKENSLVIARTGSGMSFLNKFESIENMKKVKE